jgi:D-alanyl-D-alanine carboxypeptidase
MTKHFSLPVAAALALAISSAAASAQMPVLVVDAHSGQVLISEDATRPWNPASTTKMMTAYVALRAVREGRARMDTPLVASARAAAQKPSKIGIRPGQEITLENALKVLMVKSANDVAVVVAEAIGGSIEGFSRLMNAEAQRLGMTESRFYNPHGFHADGHQTSARDLAVLTRAMLFDFPDQQDLWGIGAVQLNGRTLNNTNGLIGRYSGASGMKTGFVCASGFNLVSTASRGGRTLIAVVLGASSGGDRVVRSAQLLDQAFGMWGGGSGQTLSTLPRSGYGSAPNMRSQICTGRRRGIVLADDADYGGAILGGSTGPDAMAGGSPLAFFSQTSAAPAPRTYGVSSSGGRAILGPRVGIVPQQIYLGRAPGSTALAMGPGARNVPPAAAATAAAVPGLPASATALAPSQLRTSSPSDDARPAQRAAIRPGAQPSAQTESEPAERAANAPLQLPGVITNGPRPGAQAAIRPRQAAPAAERAAPKAQQQQKKQQTAQSGRKADPKVQNQPKKQPQQPPRRPKPANDD